jgi:hypothetical protein
VIRVGESTASAQRCTGTRVNGSDIYRISVREHCGESHTSKIEETPMNRNFQRDAMFLLRSITMFDKKRNSLSPAS